MHCKPCEQLDDYLDGALAIGDAATFESHLTDCVDCRRAVAQNAAIAGWVIEACAAADAVPTALEGRITRRIRGARIRRIVAALAASCAAIVLVGVILWLAREDHRADESKSIVETISSPQQDPISKQTQVQVVDKLQYVDGSNDISGDIVTVAGDVIAVPIPTDRSDVTIYWVYPTLKTANR